MPTFQEPSPLNAVDSAFQGFMAGRDLKLQREMEKQKAEEDEQYRQQSLRIEQQRADNEQKNYESEDQSRKFTEMLNGMKEQAAERLAPLVYEQHILQLNHALTQDKIDQIKLKTNAIEGPLKILLDKYHLSKDQQDLVIGQWRIASTQQAMALAAQRGQESAGRYGMAVDRFMGTQSKDAAERQLALDVERKRGMKPIPGLEMSLQAALPDLFPKSGVGKTYSAAEAGSQADRIQGQKYIDTVLAKNTDLTNPVNQMKLQADIKKFRPGDYDYLMGHYLPMKIREQQSQGNPLSNIIKAGENVPMPDFSGAWNSMWQYITPQDSDNSTR